MLNQMNKNFGELGTKNESRKCIYGIVQNHMTFHVLSAQHQDAHSIVVRETHETVAMRLENCPLDVD